MSVTTEKFKGFINQIAVDLGLITTAQQEQVLLTQARLIALGEKGVKPTAQFLDQDPLFAGGGLKEGWQALSAQHGITDADIDRCLTRVKSGAGISNDTPASGDIAAALKFVSQDTKNAILTAQAAVRAEQALADIDNLNAKPKTANDITKLHGQIGKRNDPEALVQAQLNNKAADELHARHKSGQAANENEIATIRAGTKAAYAAAAEMFGKLDVAGAKLVSQELNRASLAMEKQK